MMLVGRIDAGHGGMALLVWRDSGQHGLPDTYIVEVMQGNTVARTTVSGGEFRELCRLVTGEITSPSPYYPSRQ